MSKVGGLKALFNRLLGEKGLVDVNKSMLGMQRKGTKKAADYRELSSWEDFLENEAMLPRGTRLSSFAEAQNLPLGALLRVQGSPDHNIGNSFTKDWLGTHFDAADGTQVLDILAAKRPKLAKLPPQWLIEAEINPAAKFLPVSDSVANSIKSPFWSALLDKDGPFTSNRELQEALMSSGVRGLVYPNFHEGKLRNVGMLGPDLGLQETIPEKYAKEASPISISELLPQYSNPAVTLFDPREVNIKAIGKKRGGLVQASEVLK